jgi:uncharacterized Fe-S center protein
MATHVWFADLRSGNRENLFHKLRRLVAAAGLQEVIGTGDLTAIKLHFGEKGGHAYIRPVFLRELVDQVKLAGGRPFLTDSSTLYPGQRKEAVSALTCGIQNGFAYAVVDAPLIMSDGLRGTSSRRIPIRGELLSSTDIGVEILEADALLTVSHFKCHELTGFGGAIKNLGMGCSSRAGKLEQHSSVAPKVAEHFCNLCHACLQACAHDAISFVEASAKIDPDNCAGCSRCITVCEQQAIQIQWNEAADKVMRKMAEYALGAVTGKRQKQLYVNFITQVSPSCDCYGHSDAAIVPDIGILASTDPVALDRACVDLVNQARGLPGTALRSGLEPGGDKFRGVHPKIDWEITLEHAEKIGLGCNEYILNRLEPDGESW